MTSLCDSCSKPGACCNDMVLFGARWPGTAWADSWREDALGHIDNAIPGHPFIPLRLEIVEGDCRDPAAGDRDYGKVHWACTKLTPEGRCGIYEDRPQLCRDYAAGSDRLCVMYVPPASDEGARHVA